MQITLLRTIARRSTMAQTFDREQRMQRLPTTWWVAIAAMILLAAAWGRRNPLLVVFSRPFSIDGVEGALTRQTEGTTMDHTLHFQQTDRQPLKGIQRMLRTFLRAVADEHALALYAATKAALPRQTLAATRALYIPSGESSGEETVQIRTPRT